MKTKTIAAIVATISMFIIIANNTGQFFQLFGITLDLPKLAGISALSLAGSLFYLIFELWKK